jgi:hypothetical protein
MKKKTIGLLSIAAPVLIGAFAAACSQANAADNPLTQGSEAVCGKCGQLAYGDVGISGNAKLDGFFSAVSNVNNAVVSINADFETNLDSLIATFGADVKADASLDAKVTALNAAIKADIAANVDGGIKIVYAPPECHADVNLAVNAEASCEAKANCNAMVDPGNVSVSCQGKCEGSCSGSCSGSFKCDVSAGAECKGSCEGSCELTAAAACDGTCHGDCSGTCSAKDANGQCAGSCDGDCKGSCELNAGASCTGTCHGSCTVKAEADCPGGKVTCSGSCDGQCSGSCTGTATPPSASANCDASADCQASASAQANANLTCTPPSLKLDYSFKADVKADAQASFLARLSELRVRGAAMIQGFAKYSALFDGKIDGEVVIKPSPVASLVTSIQGFASLNASADILKDIPPGRIGCVVPAFNEAATELSGLVSGAKDSIAAQAKFAAAFTGGFS